MNGLLRISVLFVLRYFCNNFTWKVHHRCTCKGINDFIFINNCSTESLQFGVYKSKINVLCFSFESHCQKETVIAGQCTYHILSDTPHKHTLEWRNNIANGTCIIENQQAGRRPFDFSYTKARITAPAYKLPAFKSEAIRWKVSRYNYQPAHPPKNGYF